jgi:5-hydroxyisourate hydrolase
MGQLTTHVLDTMNGCPAAGLRVALHRVAADGATLLREITLDADGRAGGPLLAGAALTRGSYRLTFDVAGYFRGRGVALPDPPFLDFVQIDFGVADADAHYHVPLLASPWAYSTYRGS